MTKSIQDSTSQIANPKIKAFFEASQKFIAGMPAESRSSLTVLTMDSGCRETLIRWVKYFDRHVGARPAVLKLLLQGGAKAMTVPCADPMWLDSSYIEDPAPLVSRFTPEHREEMQRQVDRVMRPTYAQLKARYGNNWGIRSPDDRPARHAQFRTPAEISAEWEAEYQARRRPVPAEHPEEEIA